MSSINPNNPFTSYNLSPDEEIQGKLLNEYQKMSLQNISAELALRKVNMDWSLDPLILRLENANISGSIAIVERILRECAEAELYIREANAANFQEQQRQQETGQGGNFFNPSVIFNTPKASGQ